MKLRSLAVMLPLATALVACADAGAFACDDDSACGGGRCEPEGFCSFPDSECPSGQRFGGHAGGGLANTCVSETGTGTGGTSQNTGAPVTPDGTATIGTTSEPGDTDAHTAGDSSDDAMSSCPGWWDCAWPNRVPIVASWPGAVLDDFPVRVALLPDRFDFTATSPDAADLRVIDEDGATLAHEVELWDPEAGVAEIWVRLPRLEDGARFWLYHGNLAAVDASDPTGVWDASFVAVWHLGPALAESTGGLVLEDTGTTDAAGRIGRARAFDGVSDYLRPGSDQDLIDLFAAGATISAWIRADDFGQGSYGRIIDHASINTSADGWSLSVAGTSKVDTTDNLRFGYGYSGSSGSWRSAGSIVPGTWQHVAVAYQAGDITELPQLYVDAQTGKPEVVQAPTGEPELTTTAPPAIGALGSADLRFFDGTIDELRLSTGIRPPEWIAAEHADGQDLLLEYEPPEYAP